jgi:hypothetical protein
MTDRYTVEGELALISDVKKDVKEGTLLHLACEFFE